MRGIFTQASVRTRLNVIVLGLFLSIAIVFGGASRADVMSLPIVRLASIVTIVIAAMQLNRDQLHQIWPPLAFLAAIAALIIAQLVPLPPDWWAALPGRARFAQGLASAGIAPSWRPASLTPDLSLNSLLAVLPPLAAVMMLGAVDRPLHTLLVPLLLLGVVISALLGLLQVSSGGPYFYNVTNEGSAVGFFANRNHLALFIALALPLAACWAALPHSDHAYRRMRFWLFLCMVAAVFPLLLITGSRAGLIVALVGVLMMVGLNYRTARGDSATENRKRWRIWAIPVSVGVAAVFFVLLMSRGVALQRLLDGKAGEERVNNLPQYFTMVHDFFPFGSGLGSFDPIYRSYEPTLSISAQYLNHAHNDIVQIAIEAGAPALLLLILFLGWFAFRGWRVWSRRIESSTHLLGRGGSVIVLLILLSSVVDYPLRTPAMAAVMAIACCWMLPNLRTSAGKRPNEKVGTAPSLR